jgi:hypothetical protein
MISKNVIETYLSTIDIDQPDWKLYAQVSKNAFNFHWSPEKLRCIRDEIYWIRKIMRL